MAGDMTGDMSVMERAGRPGLRAENLRKAFRAYVAAGGNHEYACKLLSREGLDISGPTMADWAGRHNFKERARIADALMSAPAGDGAALIRVIAMSVLERYRLYFAEEGGGLDPTVMVSLAAVLKTVGKYLDDGTKRGMRQEEREETLKRILRHDFGIEEGR